MKHEDVIVFVGPTLPPEEARRWLDADYRPPARRGDVYRACISEPQLIILVDGAFESEAAVFHNEILWALSKGISVWGAASMGALRAAELASFGMIGFGTIFVAYEEGAIERDDAVAVEHGPAELGYPLLSTPLVDVWATLEKAFESGVLSACERDMLKGIASGIFYKRLGFQLLLESAVQRGLPQHRAQGLQQFLADHGIFSQKRADAIEVLQIAADEKALPRYAPSQGFVFELTSAWERLVVELEELDANNAVGSDIFESDIELSAVGLVLAEREARRRGFVLGRAEFEETARRFRYQNRLHKSSNVQQWMKVANLEHDDYVKLIEDEFLLDQSRNLVQQRLKNLRLRVNRFRRSMLAFAISKQ